MVGGTPTPGMTGSGGGTGRWLGGIDRLLRARLLSPLVSQTLVTFVASEDAEGLTALRALVESGKLAPTVDRTYPLSETAAAIRHVQEGRARGKVVIAT